MILWKKDEFDADEMRKKVSEAYKISSPEKIHGYSGYFNFCFGNIWIDCKIDKMIRSNPEYEKLLEELLQRFRKDDYGDVSEDDKDLNTENKYVFGCFTRLKGVYTTQFGVIKIEITDINNTHITMSES